jgi:hypothetical protein
MVEQGMEIILRGELVEGADVYMPWSEFEGDGFSTPSLRTHPSDVLVSFSEEEAEVLELPNTIFPHAYFQTLDEILGELRTELLEESFEFDNMEGCTPERYSILTENFFDEWMVCFFGLGMVAMARETVDQARAVQTLVELERFANGTTDGA